MMKTILGIFNDRLDVEDAIQMLKTEGFNPKDISIVMKDSEEAREVSDDTGTDVAGGALSGATTGAVLGGIAGLLAGTILPGLGGLLIGGPIGAALGLSGAAATTVSGAATGAVAGGLIGALMGLGLTKDEAEHYESRVKEGAILLAVPAVIGEENIVTRIFDECNATDVNILTQSDRGAAARNEKRIYADRELTDDTIRTSSTSSRSRDFAAIGAKGGQSRKSKKIHRSRK